MQKIILALIFSITCCITFSATVFAEMMLFVGNDCPHCERLEVQLEKNNFYQQFNIKQYEIYNNKDNLELYLRTSDALNYENGAVPLLVHNEKFIDGADPIFDYLNEKSPNKVKTTTLNKKDSDILNQMIKEKITTEKTFTDIPISNIRSQIIIGAIIVFGLIFMSIKFRR